MCILLDTEPILKDFAYRGIDFVLMDKIGLEVTGRILFCSMLMHVIILFFK